MGHVIIEPLFSVRWHARVWLPVCACVECVPDSESAVRACHQTGPSGLILLEIAPYDSAVASVRDDARPVRWEALGGVGSPPGGRTGGRCEEMPRTTVSKLAHLVRGCAPPQGQCRFVTPPPS